MNIKITALNCTTDLIKPNRYFATYEISFEMSEELILKHNLKKNLEPNQIKFIKLLKDIKPNNI